MDATNRIFDRSLLDRRRRRAMARDGSPADFLLRTAGDDLIDRLAAVTRRFGLAIDIGSPTPHLATRLVEAGQVDRVVRLDRLAAAFDQGDRGVVGDEELLPFRAASLDLAVSALWLQFANDLPGALIQIRRALKPDGLFLAALLGGETLNELRDAFAAAEAELTGGVAPHVAPFVEVRSAGALLQRAGFALPVIDQDRLTVRYATPFDLMRDLRAMGATNPLNERSRLPLRRRVVLRAAEIYTDRFADEDGRVRATFDLIWLSGWAPHESQQQPLKPGSAKMRLAEALGVPEQTAGDRAEGPKPEDR